MRLAIDPGGTAGVAWRGSDGSLRGVQWPGEDIRTVLDGFNASPGIRELVVESFLSRPGAAVSLAGVHCIGRIEAWADEQGLEIVWQTPAAAKRKVTKDVLREQGGWIRGQEHARDAIRHLLYREWKTKAIDI